MSNDPRKRGQQQAWRAGAGTGNGGGGAARGPNYKWKPEDERPPGTGGRYLKIILLSVGLVAVVAFFIWIAIKPDPTPQATLVGIAANPADDIEFLNVPLDPYGWQTAQKVTDLGKEFAKAGRDRTSPDLHPLPPDAEGLPAWADKLKDKQFDPLVLYVGLPCGTDRNGEPVLFTGGRDAAKKANRLPVRTLLETLRAEPLAGKKKVLLLDAGRIPVDPVYGLLHDDFAERMKGLNDEVKKDTNLLVIVGAGPGQRGWESEEHRTTAFGRAVMRALQGYNVTSDGSEQIKARQFVEAVTAQTETWTLENRPTAQKPLVLPENPGPLLDGIIVGVLPKSLPAEPAPPGAAPLPPEVKQAWDQHYRLAQSSPHPASYSPRAWRRYRELLLRYELCARSGEAKSAAALKGAVDVAFRTVPLPDVPSRVYSAALTAALGGADPVAEPLAALTGDATSFPDNLGKVADAFQARFPVSGPRPPEAHLPIMIREFYASVVQPPEPVPTEWAAVIDLRAKAERAALGLPDPKASLTTETWPNTKPTAYPYAERLWPVVEARVRGGDRLRRTIEDGLFAAGTSAPVPKEEFDKSLKAASDEYNKAVADALLVRTAHHVRDEAFADLPDLAKSVWFARKPGDRLTLDNIKPVRQLWADTHALAALLDETPLKVTEIKSTSEKVSKGLADLRKELRDQIEDRTRATAVTQGEWYAKQLLLACPLMRADDRETLLKLSREASEKLNAGTAVRGMAERAAQTVDPRDAAVIRGMLAKAAIGGKPPGVEVDDVIRDLDKLTTESARWSDLAAETGHALGEQIQKLSAHRPQPGAQPNAADERFSRVTLLLNNDQPLPEEPALANRRLRWRALLLGLADRAATDHWYDEQPVPTPYFDRVAKAHIASADKVAEGLPAQSVPPELTAKLAAAPLGFAKPDEVTWTSEQARRFEYVYAPTGEEYPIEGKATAVGRFASADPIRRAAKTLTPRPTYTVPFDEPLRVSADLVLPSSVTALPLSPSAEVTLYYRGQRPTPTTPIKLNRTPYLVLTDPAPRLVSTPDERAAVTVRAASDLEPPTVSILLDYSGSMGQPLDDPNAPVDKTNPNSKFQLAMKELETAMGLLPPRTVLRVRTFSQKEQLGKVWVFGDRDPEKSRVTWHSQFREPLTQLMADLRRLTPEGLTPLVKNIETAVEKDFAGATGSKILIVLTDGVEQTGADRDEGVALDARRRVLTQALKGKDVTLYVIAFGLSDKPTKRMNGSMGPSEADLSQQLFEEVPTYDPPGQVIPADNAEKLRTALLDAMRPRLRFNARTSTPPEIGVTGWPSRLRGDPTADTRPGLYWSPLVPARQSNKPTTYTVFPHPNSRVTSAQLQLDAGDRMILDLVRAPDGAVLVKRGLYGDYFPEKTNRFPGADGWVATVPGNVVDTNYRDPRYKTLVYLEQESREASDGNLLRFERPSLPNGFLWWEVTPVGAKDPQERTVRVTKKYGHAAPAWEVMADKWSVNGAYPPAQVRVWVAGSPRRSELKVKPTAATELVSTPHTVGGDPVGVRVAFESHSPIVAKGKPDGATETYVVLRVSHPMGRPVMAKLVPPSPNAEFHTEHRYFTPGEYTALFGPLEPTAFGDGEVAVELFPVAPARQAPSTVTLTPPQPEAGRPYSEYIPQPSPPRNAPQK